MTVDTKKQDYSRFYTSNRDRFMRDFDKIRFAIIDYVSNQSTPDQAEHIGHEAALYFEKILPELPFIGGDIHPGTQFILSAGYWISIYKPMIKKGYRALEIGHMMYLIYENQLKDVPPDELKKQKSETYDEAYINLMKQWAESSSPFDCDYGVEFIEGDGIDFDYGFNYRICPCFELFKAQNARPLAPFFCLLDFPKAKQLDSGFFCTKTLARGDDLCNFRYKKGKEVVQSWDTEVEKILSRQQQSTSNG